MIHEDLLLLNYDYELPKNLIANYPLIPQEDAKILVYDRKNDKIRHLQFKHLSEILPDCEIIFNDTKVIKARIYGKKQSGGKIECFLHQPLNNNAFLAQIKGRVKKGEILDFNNNLKVEILELLENGIRKIKFIKDKELLQTKQVFELLEQIGHIPLPPYIKRACEKSDEITYQSIFAKNLGAVAAPTASLHFSKNLINTLQKNHNLHFITLHVGAGTFKGVECENIQNHLMHSEFFNINEEVTKLILSDKNILCVGTTVTRCVEYFIRTKKTKGYCDLFLHPFNKPLRTNFLLTNFHLPKTTLLMLVASFIGRKKTLELYKEAILKQYRFYSYGDAMLII
ncbi:tRNA preQ1(34) S-adenosylmethionine ribosyltransferase-isomerase QueA [Campylobacter sp. LR196d]|nr:MULTISPECIES: tRNA preQ1(34) S-adenosylmethionine ribosyltransferase-isomerase QueA [unclassified Campylobacter]KAA6226724.1 tRNA preQ1(34) S-adenosylmethionine ribosyltransferase-isomerase QueA [Campylobacter sp. LR196d]KAA6229083.1 tRNA preQ1(34) S-adenosylmethionine ribosyltransferase-isomerase QueA [Campylobacter sp. LR286c]